MIDSSKISDILNNYPSVDLQMKQDIQEIIQSEMKLLLNDPGLSHLVVKKG